MGGNLAPTGATALAPAMLNPTTGTFDAEVANSAAGAATVVPFSEAAAVAVPAAAPISVAAPVSVAASVVGAASPLADPNPRMAARQQRGVIDSPGGSGDGDPRTHNVDGDFDFRGADGFGYLRGGHSDGVSRGRVDGRGGVQYVSERGITKKEGAANLERFNMTPDSKRSSP
eukprot:g1695.t1